VKQFFYHIIISVILLISISVYLPSIGEVRAVPLAKDLIQFPYRMGDWQGTDSEFNDEVLAILGVEDYLMRRYSSGDGPDIWVYVGYYQSQKEGDTIHSPKNCLLGNGWLPISSSREKIEITEGPIKTVRVNKHLVQKGLGKDLVAYFYYSGGRVVANDYLYRLGLIWDLIFKKRSDGALVRISCSVPTDEIYAWQRLRGFIQEFFPLMNAHFMDNLSVHTARTDYKNKKLAVIRGKDRMHGSYREAKTRMDK
jgi:EpsI family protein